MANRNCARRLSCSVESRKVSIQVLANVEDGRDISASVAVVRSRPDCHEVLVLEPVFEAIHDELMSTSNEFEIIYVAEFVRYLGSEQPTSTSRRESPSLNVFRIRPEQIAERSFVGKFQSSFEEADLVESFDVWRETSMDAEDFSFDNCRDSEVIEYFDAVLPRVSISILANALIVESVDCSDLSRLVVSA